MNRIIDPEENKKCFDAMKTYETDIIRRLSWYEERYGAEISANEINLSEYDTQTDYGNMIIAYCDIIERIPVEIYDDDCKIALELWMQASQAEPRKGEVAEDAPGTKQFWE